ncbi:MAG: substrate-binding domain-containing protein [Verrucomicrobia bacterium]|nr:substrate-binding domain-containing protein [Verrucomicrobiota bacterium]
MKHHLLWLLVLLWLCVPDAKAQEMIRACGAVSVALPLAEAVNVLRTERNIELVLQAGGGTGMGLEALGTKAANIALSSRELTPADKAAYPELQLVEIPIGVQLVSMAVSRDVWEGGVHALNADQVRGIYEGKITNWQQVGGPSLPIKVFMSDPGRGQWEILVYWLYKELKMAPVWRGARVKKFSETRNMLEFTPGCLSLLPPSFADQRNIFTLAVEKDGVVVEPTLTHVLEGKYPLSRPLLLVVDDKPTGAVKVIVDFMTGERGQALVKQFGYVTLAEFKAAKEKR